MGSGPLLQTEPPLIIQHTLGARQVYNTFTSSFTRDSQGWSSTIAGTFTTSNGETIFIPAQTGTIQDDTGNTSAQQKETRNAIIGGTIGGVASVALAGAALFFLRRRRRRKAKMESFEIGSEHGQEVQERVGGGVNGGSSGDLLVDSVPRPYMVSLVPSLPPTPQTPHQVYMRPQVNFAGIGARGIQGQYQQQQQRLAGEMRDMGSRESDQVTLTEETTTGNLEDNLSIIGGNLSRDPADMKRAQAYVRPDPGTVGTLSSENGHGNGITSLSTEMTTTTATTNATYPHVWMSNEHARPPGVTPVTVQDNRDMGTPDSRYKELPPHYSESVSP